MKQHIHSDAKMHGNSPAAVRAGATELAFRKELSGPMAVPMAGGHDFGRMRVGTTDLLRRAASEGSAPLEPGLRERFEGRLGADLGNVRIHNGTASAEAANRIGARAYTLGNRIHLGSEVSAMGAVSRSRLLAHEVVHTVQQGGVNVMPHEGLAVSSPQDAAEREAEQIAGAMDGGTVGPMHGAGRGSRSMAMRESLRGGRAGSVARMVKPHLQRVKVPAGDGDFDYNMTINSKPGGASGLKGTISFKPNDKAPDSDSIKMLQVARGQEANGKDAVLTGNQANLDTMRTKKTPDVTEGFFVDHDPMKAKARTTKKDDDVSPYYRTYWPNAKSSHDGSKKGKAIVDASLWDSPGADGEAIFRFETAAKANDATGYIYATLQWGFTITDAAKGKVVEDTPAASGGPSPTFKAAVKNFDEFYKNNGSSGAPK